MSKKNKGTLDMNQLAKRVIDSVILKTEDNPSDKDSEKSVAQTPQKTPSNKKNKLA